MMRDLDVGQWELDGTHLMVSDRRDKTSQVRVVDIDTGTADSRSQDTDNPTGDDRMFGRDLLTAPLWTLTLAISGDTARDALNTWRVLKAGWTNEIVRRQPGAASVLRVNMEGAVSRVYGRGRKPSEAVKQALTRGTLRTPPLLALAEFQLTDPNVYDDKEASLDLGLVTTPGTGATWPRTWPVTFGASPGLRQGVVNVEGEASTPFRAVISGPVTGKLTGPFISGAGWRIDLPGLQVAYDETLVVDTRARTVEKNGVSVASGLTRRSDPSARLMPGSQEVVFGCTDPTNTAHARVYWRPAHHSL